MVRNISVALYKQVIQDGKVRPGTYQDGVTPNSCSPRDDDHEHSRSVGIGNHRLSEAMLLPRFVSTSFRLLNSMVCLHPDFAF